MKRLAAFLVFFIIGYFGYELIKVYFIEPANYKQYLSNKFINKGVNKNDVSIFVDSFFVYLDNKYKSVGAFPKTNDYSTGDIKEYFRLLVKVFVKDSAKIDLAKKELDSVLYKKIR